MLKFCDFTLKKYKWRIIFYYNASSRNDYNTADIYTNMRDRVSVVMINRQCCYSQFINTMVHEINHIGSYIEEYFNIDPHGEHASYIMGEIAQGVVEHSK